MLEKQIEKYISFYLETLQEIRTISTKSQELFCHILYLGLLDALSKSVYPHKGPRDRVTSLILRFGNWPHATRVSLIHLLQLLKKYPDPDFEQLRIFTMELIQKSNIKHNPISIDVDPEYEEVRAKWPKTISTELPGGIKLEYLKHINLFYSLRNSIIHEMRKLGEGFDIGTHSEPYYINILNIELSLDTYESIELVYPLKFLDNICNNCIQGVNNYLIANSLNPYDYYESGTFWLPDLN